MLGTIIGVGGAIKGAMTNKSATQRGNDQRDYMDAAYGDLNQWEQAGAGQSGDATQAASNTSQEKISWASLRSQESVQMRRIDADLAIAGISSDASGYAADSVADTAKAGQDQQQPIIDANVDNAIKDLDLKEATHENLKAQLDILRKGNTTAGKSAIDFENMLQDDPSLASAIGAILGSIPMGAEIAKIMGIKLPKKLPKTNNTFKKSGRGSRTTNKPKKQAKKNTPSATTRKQRRDSRKDPSKMTEAEQWDTFAY